MVLTLIDKDFGLYKFKRYLDFYLRGKLDYNHVDVETNKIIFKSTIHYYNLNNDNNSIFYLIDEGIFYFGLDDEIDQYINNRAIISISGNFKFHLKLKNAFHFARDSNNEENILLLIPVDYENLSNVETSVFLKKNKIVTINNRTYINFGGIKENITILRNLRNFMSRTSVDININSFLKVNSTYVPNNFNDSELCNKCHKIISESYKNKEFFKEFIPNNRGFCVDCYSTMLMGYFVTKNNFPIFMQREILKKLSKNDDVFNFYLNLFDVYDMFDDEGILLFDDLKSNYHGEKVPYRVSFNNKKYQMPKFILNQINDFFSPQENDDFSYIEDLIIKNQLPYHKIVEIRNQLETDALFNLFGYYRFVSDKKIKMDIKTKVNQYINKIKKSNGSKNYFERISKLNMLTLNSNGGFNKKFLDRIISEGLDKECCVKIRNELIEGIYDNSIDDVEEEFNNRIESIIEKYRVSSFVERKYYNFNNNIYLKVIIKDTDQYKLFKSINSFKSFVNIELENFYLNTLSEGYIKMIANFKVDSKDLKFLERVMENHGFDKVYGDIV